MFRHTYPGTDPDEMTQLQYLSMVRRIPTSILKEFGYKVDDIYRAEAVEMRREFLATYLEPADVTRSRLSRL